MSASLKNIKAFVATELEHFDRFYKDALSSKAALLEKITYYVVQNKGKQMRPLLVFLAAKMTGQVNEKTYSAATFIELLHTATLAHDDVVDESYKRRGFFSLKALWNNKIAVLVGDYFLSKGMLLALEKKHYQILHIFSNAVKDMSEGELLQMEKARKLNIQEDIYFEIIRQKTASLLAASTASGAASTDQDDETIARMHTFGEKLGIAFQIKDDLFDFGQDDVGKPLGIDIQEKKMTLPLIYVLEKASFKDKIWIKNIVKRHNKNKQKVQELIAYVKQHGGIEYATEKMYAYRQEAIDVLNSFPPSEARDHMTALVDFTISRKK